MIFNFFKNLAMKVIVVLLAFCLVSAYPQSDTVSVFNDDPMSSLTLGELFEMKV